MIQQASTDPAAGKRGRFYSFDGDEVGRRLQALILDNDLDGIVAFSRTASASLEALARSIAEQGATIIFAAGDSIMAWSESELDVATLPVTSCGVRFSVGVGDTPREALIGLTKAKVLGNGGPVRYRERLDA